MIEFKNVTFAYNEKPVLRNISFKVDASESLVIMGPSGSGKSTILRLALGLERPQEGEIYFENRNICQMKDSEMREIRKKIGMVFQDGALFDSLSVGENVGYYLIEHTKMSYDEIEVKAREMLGFVGLDADEIIDKLPEELSGGMQRRVAIGRTLLSTNPSIMLFDEPTTGLDPKSIKSVLSLIAKLKKEKAVSTISVTHQIADALALSDRFLVIIDGLLLFDGTMDKLRTEPNEEVQNFLVPFRESFDAVAKSNLMKN